MRHDLSIACVLATVVCVTPGVVAAQEFMLEEVEEKKPVPIYTSEVEAGVGYNTEDSSKFGEYTGLEEEGPFGIGNFTLGLRSPYDSEDSLFLYGTGTDLGLESRSVFIEGGRQGTIKGFLEFDQIPRNQLDDARTPFLGAGGGNLTLPSGWDSDTSTQGMTTLRSSLMDVEIETERKRFGGGLTWNPFENWEIKAEAHRELKDGLDTIGATFATNGGNTRGAILPEPIDYVTDIFEASVGYTGERLQAQLGYEFSMFKNHEDTLRFQNPFDNPGGFSPWAAGAAFPTGVGEFQLPPDNTAHHVSLSGGYTLGRMTRLTGNFVYGRLEQDEDFLPFSANPLLTVTTPLPRDSLEGEIETYLVNLGLSTELLRDLDFDARYRFDYRDNNTPQDVFVRIAGDAQNQPVGLATANARINLPYNLEQHNVDLEAGYRVLPRTKVIAGYEYDQRERDFEVVSTTREHTVTGKIQTTPVDFATGWVEYGHGFRDGSTYKGNRAFIESHTQEFLATLAPGEDFENDPRLRKFWVADRDRDFVNGNVTFMPLPEVAIGFSGGYSAEDYDDSIVGLRERDMFNGTVDLSYSPMSALLLHAFATYEHMRYKQRGCQFNSSAAQQTICFDDPSDTTRDWEVETLDKIVTVGTGFQASVIEDTLDFGADYAFSRGRTTVDPTGGSALQPVLPFPDLESRLHSFNVRLDYKPRPDVSVRFGYLFEKLSTRDFAIDGVDVDTVEEVISLGESSPDYVAHVFGVSVAFRF